MNDDLEFTPYARQAIDGAEAAAVQFNHAYVGTEHILCAIFAMPKCEACLILEKLGEDPEELMMELERVIGRGEPLRSRGELPYTARTRKIIERAKIDAKRLKAPAVGTDHLILAMLEEREREEHADTGM